MKILQIITSLNPADGGPMEALKQSLPIIQALGHHVEVVTLDNPESLWLSDFPTIVHALGPTRLNYRFCPKLIGWLSEHVDDFDVVIVRGIWQYGGFATWRVLKNKNIPYYVFTHGMLDPWFKKNYPLKHLKKWLYWVVAEYWVLRNAKAVLFTSEEEKILARQSFWLYRCNEKVVNYGTSLPQGNIDEQRHSFYNQFPSLKNKRLLLFLSRIHPKKGCDILIEAFSKVAHIDDALHLVIAGPDQIGWKKDLLQLAKQLNVSDKITWTGMITGDLKFGAINSSDAFVLPSHGENFGIVVSEVLACNLPVLISNKVNIWREIEQENAGLVGEDTLESTVFLLEKWLGLSVEKKLEMKANARECFLRNFEIKNAVVSLINTLDVTSKNPHD